MPPLQKGTSFKRKDIAKAFFDLDLADSEPSPASKTLKPRDRTRLMASKPSLDEDKRKQQSRPFDFASRDTTSNLRCIELVWGAECEFLRQLWLGRRAWVIIWTFCACVC